MKLQDYLNETEETQEQFAKRVGLSRITINTYINKGVIPKPNHYLRINKATEQKVTYKDFCEDKVEIIKQQMERYDIKLKQLSYMLGKTEVAIHKKLTFQSNITEWEIYTISKYIKNIINQRKERQNAI